jgi:hypothetical protein
LLNGFNFAADLPHASIDNLGKAGGGCLDGIPSHFLSILAVSVEGIQDGLFDLLP